MCRYQAAKLNDLKRIIPAIGNLRKISTLDSFPALPDAAITSRNEMSMCTWTSGVKY
jgi:hypothetical protein